jgi:hypothetical protein
MSNRRSGLNVGRTSSTRRAERQDRRRNLRNVRHLAERLELENLKETRDYARWLLALQQPR